uniref:Uncharacterized protein n=1 Tax=Lactuca sativa TaxID=4236 RepID=A0A9R1XM65_LACSA|nr:hypothetical protein LSAT_V11C300138230 [Lactuca sativa]
MSTQTFVEILLAIVLPPLGVIFKFGCKVEFWICLLLTLFGWIPGIIYAVYEEIPNLASVYLHVMISSNDKVEVKVGLKYNSSIVKQKALEPSNPRGGRFQGGYSRVH